MFSLRDAFTAGLFIGSLVSMMLAVGVYHITKSMHLLEAEATQGAATIFIGIMGILAAFFFLSRCHSRRRLK
jgi:hypothetical protein